MNCSEFNEKISVYIDDELSKDEKDKFELHISTCKTCREEYDNMINIIKSLSEIENKPIPDNFDETLRIKLEKERKKAYNKSLYKKYLPIAAGLLVIVTSTYFINNIIKIDNKQDLGVNKEIASTYKEEKIKADKDQESELKSINIDKNNDLAKKEDVSKETKNSNIIYEDNSYKNNSKSENKIEEQSSEPLIASSSDTNENLNYKIENINENAELTEDLSENNIRAFSKVEKSIMLDNNINEKYSNIGEIISIEMGYIEGNKGTWHYSIDSKGIIELISENIESVGTKKVYVWKFKTIGLGKINIKYELYEDTVPDKIYETKEYIINVVKQNE